MGSVFSKPKMPKSSTVPISISTGTVTKPVTPSPTENGDPPNGSGGGNTDNAPEVTPDEQRVQNILTRNRGRLGTISTSFNGVLSDASTISPARKTLLGE